MQSSWPATRWPPSASSFSIRKTAPLFLCIGIWVANSSSPVKLAERPWKKLPNYSVMTWHSPSTSGPAAVTIPMRRRMRLKTVKRKKNMPSMLKKNRSFENTNKEMSFLNISGAKCTSSGERNVNINWLANRSSWEDWITTSR